jgi:hypothetical protein
MPYAKHVLQRLKLFWKQQADTLTVQQVEISKRLAIGCNGRPYSPTSPNECVEETSQAIERSLSRQRTLWDELLAHKALQKHL